MTNNIFQLLLMVPVLAAALAALTYAVYGVIALTVKLIIRYL